MAHMPMPPTAPGCKPGMAPMWVTVPMWMPPGSAAPGVKPTPFRGPNDNNNNSTVPQGPPFPFAMPFFVPPGGASGPGRNGSHPAFMPHGYPGLEPFASVPSVSPPSSVEGDQDLPTHAPCA